MCGIAGVMDLAGRRVVPREISQADVRCLDPPRTGRGRVFRSPGDLAGFAAARASSDWPTDGSRCRTRTRTLSWFSTVSFSITSRNAGNFERVAIDSRTHCDTEIIPHLWEENQEGMFERLRGQFAIALWDVRRHQLILGRDRFGIAPLYWTRQGDWLLFASEIKALLASGMVRPGRTVAGWTTSSPSRRCRGRCTCFEGVQTAAAGPLFADHSGERSRRGSRDQRAHLLGNGFPR